MREAQPTERREGLSSARVSAENGNQHSGETQEAGAEDEAPRSCGEPPFPRCPPTQHTSLHRPKPSSPLYLSKLLTNDCLTTNLCRQQGNHLGSQNKCF